MHVIKQQTFNLLNRIKENSELSFFCSDGFDEVKINIYIKILYIFH